MLITSLLLVKPIRIIQQFKIHAQFAHQFFLTFEKYLFLVGDQIREAMLPFIDNLDFFGK